MARRTVALLLLLLAALTSASEFTVTLDQGTLRGTTLNSKDARTFVAFQGIPFAAPPVGDLRFQPPQEAVAWSGERASLPYVPSCPQINYLTRVYEGQEDCLFLSVYTPKLEREGDGLSVMVWIHGGGFFSGSGNTVMYGPQLIMDHDVVLVTINYRLGVLGFLSQGTKDVPGNYGMKDQVAALRWVQKNIAKFGGNPNSVTIFGESAGGSCVHYLMLSPLARGLFHRAIAQSGSALHDWSIQRHPLEMANALAEKMGCPVGDGLVACLRGKDPKTLEEADVALQVEKNRATVFVPAVEPGDTPDYFLAHEPLTLQAGRDISDVPLIAGLTTHEGMYKLGGLDARQVSVEDDLANNFYVYVPEMLGYARGSDNFLAVWNEIKAYFEQLVPDNIKERYILLNSDAEFVPGVDEFVRSVAKLQRSPVYYYQFSYDGGLSLMKTLLQMKYNGTCHGDELGYMFTGPAYPSQDSATAADLRTIDRITKMWTDFAKTGNPTSADSSLGVEWKPVDASSNEIHTRYLDIGAELVMKDDNLNGGRVAFWQKLIQQHRAIS